MIDDAIAARTVILANVLRERMGLDPKKPLTSVGRRLDHLSGSQLERRWEARIRRMLEGKSPTRRELEELLEKVIVPHERERMRAWIRDGAGEAPTLETVEIARPVAAPSPVNLDDSDDPRVQDVLNEAVASMIDEVDDAAVDVLMTAVATGEKLSDPVRKLLDRVVALKKSAAPRPPCPQRAEPLDRNAA